MGVRTLHYLDKKRVRPVVIELWYPLDPSREEPHLIRDADLAIMGSRFPLIMMSHGHQGDRLNQDWLAIQLAKKGYVVASVEHFGNTLDTFHPLQTLKFWDRAKDVSFAIDQLLEKYKGEIDENRIGFIGYSMGGMTGLGLAGAQAKNLKEIIRRESQNYKGFTDEDFKQVDFTEGEKLHEDSRIKAMVLLCPANFIYPPESLKMIKIPIGIVAAFHDEVLPHKEHAGPIIRHLIPRTIKMIRKKVSHSFLSKAFPQFEESDQVVSEVASFSLEFFKTHL